MKAVALVLCMFVPGLAAQPDTEAGQDDEAGLFEYLVFTSGGSVVEVSLENGGVSSTEPSRIPPTSFGDRAFRLDGVLPGREARGPLLVGRLESKGEERSDDIVAFSLDADAEAVTLWKGEDLPLRYDVFVDHDGVAVAGEGQSLFLPLQPIAGPVPIKPWSLPSGVLGIAVVETALFVRSETNVGTIDATSIDPSGVVEIGQINWLDEHRPFVPLRYHRKPHRLIAMLPEGEVAVALPESDPRSSGLSFELHGFQFRDVTVESIRVEVVIEDDLESPRLLVRSENSSTDPSETAMRLRGVRWVFVRDGPVTIGVIGRGQRDEPDGRDSRNAAAAWMLEEFATKHVGAENNEDGTEETHVVGGRIRGGRISGFDARSATPWDVSSDGRLSVLRGPDWKPLPIERAWFASVIETRGSRGEAPARTRLRVPPDEFVVDLVPAP